MQEIHLKWLVEENEKIEAGNPVHEAKLKGILSNLNPRARLLTFCGQRTGEEVYVRFVLNRAFTRFRWQEKSMANATETERQSAREHTLCKWCGEKSTQDHFFLRCQHYREQTMAFFFL